MNFAMKWQKGIPMSNNSFNGASALLAHMVEGNPVSLIEAMLLFGVQSPNAEFGRMKKAGYIIQRQKNTMIKVLRRLNNYSKVTVPSNLPISEIVVTEYWINM